MLPLKFLITSFLTDPVPSLILAKLDRVAGASVKSSVWWSAATEKTTKSLFLSCSCSWEAEADDDDDDESSSAIFTLSPVKYQKKKKN